MHHIASPVLIVIVFAGSHTMIGFPGGSVVNNPPANTGDARYVCLISGSRRSPGIGNGNPLQYSWLEKPIDRGAWWATVYGVAESDVTEHTWAAYYDYD